MFSEKSKLTGEQRLLTVLNMFGLLACPRSGRWNPQMFVRRLVGEGPDTILAEVQCMQL